MRTLVLFSASAAFACLVSLHLPVLFLGIFGACFLCTFFVLRKRARKRKYMVWISLGLAAGFLWFGLYSALFYFPAQQLEYKTIRMEAVITDWPSKTEYGISAKVRGGQADGRSVPMLLYLDDSFSDLRPGDRISAIAHCTPSSQIHGKQMLTFRSKGIYLFARTYGTVTVTPASHISPRYYPVFLAHSVRDSISTLYSQDAASLQYALLTGWQEDLSDEDQNAFSRTGLSHVVSVSGMHVSFLAGALFFLLGRGKKSTAVIQIVVIFFFAAMAGNAPGALRAAILCSASLIAPLLGRKSDTITSLFAAVLFLLVLNPFSIANAGLQFSFAATFGIYLVGLPLYTNWHKRLPKPGRRIASIPLSILAVSLGAILFTIPLSALYFGQVSLIAPITNLITNWTVSVSFLGGILSVCAAKIWLPLGALVATLTEIPIFFFLWSARFFSKLPFAALSLESVYYPIAFVFLYTILLVYLFWWRKGFHRVTLPACSCIVAFCVAVLLTNLTVYTKPLVFTALDVGQGQSIVLSSGSYRALVDCGGSKQARAVASDYLHHLGWSSLDLLVLTHYHEDHCNGVSELMDRIDVRAIAIPDTDKGLPSRQEVEREALEHGVEIWYITEASKIPFGKAELTLYPPLSSTGDNEACLTILCKLGTWEALVTGDMDGATEKKLLATYNLPDIELLVLGHHGSRYSTSWELLRALTPEHAIVSVGENTFGHPSQETLDRLKETQTTVYRTDRMGTITVYADDQED